MEGRKKERKEETEIGRLIIRLRQERGAQQKGNLKVLRERVIISKLHREELSEEDRERGERWLGGLFYLNRNMKDCQTSHLEFPPGVEFLQALHSLLPVHHGGYSGPLLQVEDERIRGLGIRM